jgi:phage tail sheath protein FI
LWDDSTENPDVDETSQRLQDRVIDSSYGVTYFPDVYIEDTKNNNSVVQVPTSVVAVGALAFTDREYRPWFAPAGFSRGALNQVRNTRSRLTAGDRDTLYEASINPIATFPTTTEPEFVIFGQKTLQLAQTALDRINVRRMLIDVKRAIITVSRNLVFEQNTPAIRARFISRVTPILAIVQAQQGIEKFRVIMDDSNNTLEDAIQNKLNGSIIIVPTRTVEFIAMDFIIDTAGVTFKD